MEKHDITKYSLKLVPQQVVIETLGLPIII